MKKIAIILMFFIFMSCEKDNLELTGMEGKLINQKGEVQKTFKIYYSVFEFIPNGFVGGKREIRGPIAIVSDSIGNFKISEILKYRQSLDFRTPSISNNKLIDTFYVKSPIDFNGKEIIKGKYYRDVIIVVKK